MKTRCPFLVCQLARIKKKKKADKSTAKPLFRHAMAGCVRWYNLLVIYASCEKAKSMYSNCPPFLNLKESYSTRVTRVFNLTAYITDFYISVKLSYLIFFTLCTIFHRMKAP